jgi:shikimate dehydrogenase
VISGKTLVFGIFGHPVEHSFSPGMHNAAFATLRIDACYVPFTVSPEKLGAAIKAMIPLGIRGLNITVPHKEKIIAFLDDLTEDARLIGAVNTIEVKGTRLIGHNTDGRGFLRSLQKETSFRPKGKTILILGSGGAARAIGFSLALAGAREILLNDLDARKATRLASDIRAKTGAQARAIKTDTIADAIAASHALINATPQGLKKSDSIPLPKGSIRSTHLVCDLIYNPPMTGLLQEANRQGAATLSGIGMLLYQGVIAFEIWTARRAPVKVMRDALLKQMQHGGK